VSGLAIELVVEDRAHRAVGQRADLDCPRGRRFEAVGAERPHQADNAQAETEALWISSHKAAVAGPIAVAACRRLSLRASGGDGPGDLFMGPALGGA
jgi:hypothetical protein